MAKNRENNGLFGSVMGLAEEAKQNIEKRNTIQLHNTHTQQTYTIKQEEKRNKRVQIVVKPSVNAALDRLAQQGKIKSKNDLVNFLIEDYLARFEQAAGSPTGPQEDEYEQIGIDDVLTSEE